MTPRDFVYWLQGVFEVTNPEALTAEQIAIIRAHIELVLKKETPAPGAQQWAPLCGSGSINIPGGGLTLTC